MDNRSPCEFTVGELCLPTSMVVRDITGWNIFTGAIGASDEVQGARGRLTTSTNDVTPMRHMHE
ncbi:MAG: hypothetical protein H6822_11900 [Planctomycetaceae bacterium]|nr:hypothetical protein [Planctomycetaceae bacterium]